MSRLIEVLVVAILIAGSIFLQLTVGTGLFTDDPFISFRYAQNLLKGHGLVFNPGERVEGYTNFLWTLILALGMRLGFDPVSFSRYAGIGFHTLTLLVVMVVSRCTVNRFPHYLLAPLILTTDRSFLKWGAGGLEAPLMGFLITSSLLWTLAPHSRCLAVCSGLLGGLAGLTRPEGLLVLGLGWLVFLRSAVKQPQASRSYQQPLLYLAGGLLVAAPYQIWRLGYYQQLLPNTFHAKVSASTAVMIRGFTYSLDFIRDHGDIALLVLVIAGLAARKQRPELTATIIVLGYTAAIILIGGDWMAFHRFYVPILGPLALVLQLGLLTLSNRFHRKRYQLVLIVLAVGYLAAQPIIPRQAALSELIMQTRHRLTKKSNDGFIGAKIPTKLRWREESSEERLARDKSLGLWLKANSSPTDTLAIGTIGIIPFYSELYTIDFFGLTDKTIAHGPKISGFSMAGHEKFDLNYILARRPTYLIFSGQFKADPHQPNYWVKILGFLYHPDFIADYELQTIETMGYKHSFYRRKR